MFFAVVFVLHGNLERRSKEEGIVVMILEFTISIYMAVYKVGVLKGVALFLCQPTNKTTSRMISMVL